MRERMKKTKVNHLTLDTHRRIIFVSDIHGDVDTFKLGLEKVGFSDKDYLFVLGDLIEKGNRGKNLETFRYFMELSKKENVYCMSGNCDEVFRFVLPPNDEEKFKYYVVGKKHSILNDIADEMNYPIHENMDVDDFVTKVEAQYTELYDFMDSLDDVIFINDEIVLVHGGIDDLEDIPEYALSLLKYDNYYRLAKPTGKIVIVGHYPASNYRDDVSCVNPFFGHDKRIISIDGGNHIVKGGQLNFVVLSSLYDMRFTYTYVDHYPKYVMKQSVNYDHPERPVSVSYNDNEIEILDSDLDFTYVKHVRTGICMWVHSSFVYQNHGKYYAFDASNTFLSVNAQDEISIVKVAKPYSIIKRNGYIGLIETRYLEYEDTV